MKSILALLLGWSVPSLFPVDAQAQQLQTEKFFDEMARRYR